MLSWGGGGRQFYTNQYHGVCIPAASGFRIFMRFFANRASTRYARERGDISPQQCVCGIQTALFSSLQVLQATKESC